jgi:hypothetical protein
MDSGRYLDRIKFLGDDLFYNLEMFIKAEKVKVVDKPLYFYRWVDLLADICLVYLMIWLMAIR